MRLFAWLTTCFVAFCFAAITLTLDAQAQSQPEKRIAFVVGNSAYPDAPLVTPANDAGLIAQTLQAAGFDVVGARDLDQDSLRHSFGDFINKANAAGPGTVAFVYLDGYGLQFEGENYFVPVDAHIANPADVPIAAIRLSDLTKPLAALPLKVSIVVLDGGRQSPFANTNQPLAGGLALVDPDPRTLVAFNATPGTVAPNETGPYGVYAQSLAEMIRTGGLRLSSVFDKTRLRVSEKTNGALLPWSASKVTEPFVFFERSANAPALEAAYGDDTAVQAKPIRDFDERDAYVAALDRDTLRGYEDFLAAYPNDPMAKRVWAIVAARREAITWHQTWMSDRPETYWSYLRRYPHGPHAWDARRRLSYLQAALEPPPSFAAYDYDVPAPPPAEIVYVDRPVFVFSDPSFDLPPPPPPPVIFLPPQPREFVELPPPPPPVGAYVLPTPEFVPVPDWVNPPRFVAPPPDTVIFNNIHNTTIIENQQNQTQPANQGSPGLTTGEKLTGAAIAAGAAAAALKVALPPSLQKKVGPAPATPVQSIAPALPAQPLPAKTIPGQNSPAKPVPGQPQSSQLPAAPAPAHTLPGMNGQPLPATSTNLPASGQPNATQPNSLPKPAASPATIPGQNGKPASANQVLPGRSAPAQNDSTQVTPAKPAPGQSLPGQAPAKPAPAHALPGTNGQPLPVPSDKSPAATEQAQVPATNKNQGEPPASAEQPVLQNQPPLKKNKAGGGKPLPTAEPSSSPATQKLAPVGNVASPQENSPKPPLLKPTGQPAPKSQPQADQTEAPKPEKQLAKPESKQAKPTAPQTSPIQARPAAPGQDKKPACGGSGEPACSK